LKASAAVGNTVRQDGPNLRSTVLDATKLPTASSLQKGTFTKAFSNAALHWILRNPESRQDVFNAVGSALQPGGIFALEMGGLGNVSEMRTALLMAVSRRVGLPAALAADPWFFPDEAWITKSLETAGFRVDKVEREWRPTAADSGGVEGWVRLFGKQVLDAVEDEKEREAAVKEAADVLNVVCNNPGGGQMISYVRLRALATKL
jgi:trans-aconitate methyltransferase